MSGGTAGSQRKGLAIASLVLGILSLPTFGLLLVGAVTGIVLGIVALVKASREPAAYGGKGLAITGIVLCTVSVVVMPFFLGIIAAIAIPSLLRARVAANEAAAIGDARTVLSAEIAYQSVNGGLFDTLECLGTPQRCIPGYSGSAFLDPTLVVTEKNGYRRRFFAGPPPASPPPGPASPSSMTAFAYVASPAERNKTGVRSFCVDASGRLCFLNSGEEIDATGGVCPETCPPLR